MSISKIIEELKLLTVTEKKDPKILMNFFLTHIAENSTMMDASKPNINESNYFKTLLTPVTNYYGTDITVNFMILLNVLDTDFFHGCLCLSNSRLVTFYFFKDIQMGLAASTGSPFSESTDLFRISAFLCEGKDKDKLIIPEKAFTTLN